MIICDRCAGKDAEKCTIQTQADHPNYNDGGNEPRYKFDIDLCKFCKTEYAKIIADFRKPKPSIQRS